MNFKQLFEYYKPLIDAKNKAENQDILKRNIFQDDGFYEEVKTMNQDGTENVNKFLRPYEMRLFDLRK